MATVRFGINGFIKPEEAEAIKLGLKEAVRQIEIGQELQVAYNLPDVPTASLITLAFRNSFKAYLEGVKQRDESAGHTEDKPETGNVPG